MLQRLFASVALILLALIASSAGLQAGQARTATEGVYSGAQATRGQAAFKDKCAPCHGEMLEGVVGPPLTGDEFLKAWGNQPLSELVDKIQKTMPQNEPGTLTRPQTLDLVAHILQVGKFPPGPSELPAGDAALKLVVLAPNTAAPAAAALSPVASHATAVPPPSANLAQLMRGIFFPSSNIIFNVQGHDPGEKKDGKPYEPSATDNFSWADWGAGIYSPWEVVDFAALAIADAAPLLLVPRRCENGRSAPVERDDWNKFALELIDAGKAAYKASQSRSQEAVSDVSNQLADACLHCHEVYRDKPGGTVADPSNKAARCF
ncbi:MAG TPA: cytochrome c [Vicinamibacterales bacterium]|jgi:mono/diheme cytochrome c family protein